MALFACQTKRPNEGIPIKKIDAALDQAKAQALLMARTLADMPGRLPKSVHKDGTLETCSSSWWTSGFFPGLLWYLYEFSGDDSLKYWAGEFTERVSDQQYTTDNHDVGFMIFCSFGNGYRVTGNEAYLPVLRNASASLSTRFHPLIGCIRSWDRAPWNEPWQYAVIIDNMMNLELLEWSAKEFNMPAWDSIARIHANTTLKNHFRPDGSSYHVLSYDTLTGAVEYKHTAQGYSHESAWARGQAWGLYGFTLMFRETADSAYLQQAVAIADFLCSHPNLPDDKIPYWDYNAPAIPDEPRDASAGAIMCSALLELHRYLDPDKGEAYLRVAEQQLESLCSPAYFAERGTNSGFLLKHSVGHRPNGTEVDVPLSYADYYFVEALMRYRKLSTK